MRTLKFFFIISTIALIPCIVWADETKISGIRPSQPMANLPMRSSEDNRLVSVSITGSGFAAGAEVVFSYDDRLYPIRHDRKNFVSGTEIEVQVNLTPGTWSVQVDNSNVFRFAVENYPSREDVSSSIEFLARENDIPPMIIKGIAWQENYWRHYDPDTFEYDPSADEYNLAKCDPEISSDGGYGMMQRTPNSPSESDIKLLGDPWYNLNEGVSILLKKWDINIGGNIPALMDYDKHKSILENWYYAIAWYNGKGERAYNYVMDVYENIENPPVQIAAYCTPVKITPPQAIPTFSKQESIDLKLSGNQIYTLRQIAEAGGIIHQWNENSNRYVDITNAFVLKIPTIWLPPELTGVTEPFSLVHVDQDSGLVVARSGRGEDAVSLSFQAKKTRYLSERGHSDANSFAIYWKGWLSGDPGDGSSATWAHNSILIDGEGQPAISIGPGELELVGGKDDDKDGHIDDDYGYLYAKGEASKAYCDGLEAFRGRGSVEEFSREIVYIRPSYIVVFDRVRMGPTSITHLGHSKKWLLHFRTEPVISGDVAMGSNGNAKLFCKILLPESFTIHSEHEEKHNNWFDTWRIEVQPTSRYKGQFLHVLYIAEPSTTEMPRTSRIYGYAKPTDENATMIGGQIGNWAVLFGSTEEKVDLVYYTVTGNGTFENVLFGMKPNIVYTVHKNDTAVLKQITSDDNGILTFNLEIGNTDQVSVQMFVGGEELGQPGKPIHIDF